MEAMKPFASLSIHDLEIHPVWRFETVGDVESVSPTDLTALSESSLEVFVAATDFRLADGSCAVGVCSPQDASGLDYIQPVVFTPRGQVRFWHDLDPGDAVLAEEWSRLAKPSEAVFPVTFVCRIPCDGKKVGGTIREVMVATRAN